MPKDYPRMRKFWFWLLTIISGLYTVYGFVLMVPGLITDPMMRYACLAAFGICGVFVAALMWGPSHRFVLRHPYLLYGTGAAMFGLGIYLLMTTPPATPLLAPGLGLMVLGIFVFILAFVTRDERPPI